VLIYKEDYYLFITGYRGYWFPEYAGLELYRCTQFPRRCSRGSNRRENPVRLRMNSKSLFSSTDPRGGVWTKAATLDSDRYGDADIFIDDDGRIYMYYGWSSSFQSRWLNLTLKTDSRKRANQPFVSLAILKITDLREEEVKTLSFRSSTTAHIIPRKSHGLKAVDDKTQWNITCNMQPSALNFCPTLMAFMYRTAQWGRSNIRSIAAYIQDYRICSRRRHGSTFHDKNGNCGPSA